MSFTTIDIIIMIILGIMAVRGLFNGLIRELFSFGSLVLGLLAAMVFSKTLSAFLAEQFGSHALNDGISFFLIFLVVFVALKMAEHTIIKLMDDTAAFSVDKGLGFILGLLEGIIICSLIAYFLEFQRVINVKHILADSFFVPYFSKIFPFLESTGSAVLKSINK